MRSLSIRYKMVLLFLLILVLLGGVLAFVFQYKTQRLMSTRLKSKGVITMRALVSASREGVVNENIFGSLDNLVMSSVQDNEIERLVILDKDLSILASNIQDSNLYQRFTFSHDRLQIDDDQEEIILSSPIRAVSELDGNDEVLGYIQLILSKKVIKNEINAIIKTTTGIIFVVLFVAALIIFIVIGVLLRPILLLTKSSKRIEEGHYHDPIEIRSKDEIGDLARAFEMMRQQINIKMTETNRAKEEALKLAKFRETFLANMSHEIRTPMNGVIGMIDILTLNTELDEQQKEYVEIIKNSSRDLLAIVNDILDLSKLEAGEMTIVPRVFDYHALIHKVKSLFSGKARESGLELISEYSEGFPNFICADSNRITQVLSNFMSNAIKFTDEGSVTISSSFEKISDDKIKVKIEVIDTGVGINPKEQGIVFEEFKQLDEGSTKAFKGTGLGLAICTKLAHLMGGDIGVESEKGVGSTFWFSFEASVVEEESPIRQSESNKEIRDRFDLNILLVDDEKVNVMVAKLMLEGLGCTVETAANGKEAVDKFEEGKFDVVLMDIQMPVMDGVEATKKIKELFKKVPPIIGLSANAMVGDAERFIAEGLDDYMSKPVTFEAVKQKFSKYFK